MILRTFRMGKPPINGYSYIRRKAWSIMLFLFSKYFFVGWCCRYKSTNTNLKDSSKNYFYNLLSYFFGSHQS